MKPINTIIFICLLFCSCSHNKSKIAGDDSANKIFYKNGSSPLQTKMELDSFISSANRQMEMTGNKIYPEISSAEMIGDSTIYHVNLDVKTINNKLIGKPLPDFNFKDINGEMVHLSDLKGKPIVINLWFVECPPCKAEMPYLNAIKKRYSQTDVQFLSMTYETKEKVKKYLEKTPIEFRVIPDIDHYSDILTSNFPQTVFVNRKGIITEIQSGLIPIYDSTQKRNSDKMDETEFIAALDAIK